MKPRQLERKRKYGPPEADCVVGGAKMKEIHNEPFFQAAGPGGDGMCIVEYVP
jgi:hypothetical protein